MYQNLVLLRAMVDTFSKVKEIGVLEQRYQAALAVLADGLGVGKVAAQLGCRGSRCETSAHTDSNSFDCRCSSAKAQVVQSLDLVRLRKGSHL